MLRFSISHHDEQPLNLLCLGAHADDIEIGCGGTILRLVAEVSRLSVRWVVFSGGESERANEARNCAKEFLKSVESRVEVLDFRDGYYPFQGPEIKDVFEELKQDFEPSLVLTHRKSDAHQDHRLLADLTYSTFRNHVILEYEIPKFDGDFGNPNFFIPLSEAQVRRKIELILRHFPTQRRRGWFTEETFLAMARLRGIGCNASEGYAEGFRARKIVC